MKNSFTVVVSHFVKKEAEEAFEGGLRKVIEKAKAYEGHQNSDIIKTGDHSEQEYILLIRFDTEANYQEWAHSEPRNSWFEELKDYTYKESEIRYEEGIEFWFSTPQSTTKAPPKWKTALLAWMVIYPSVLVLSKVAGLLLPNVPLFLRVFIVSIILVSAMTYWIMPGVTKVFSKWIYKE